VVRHGVSFFFRFSPRFLRFLAIVDIFLVTSSGTFGPQGDAVGIMILPGWCDFSTWVTVESGTAVKEFLCLDPGRNLGGASWYAVRFKSTPPCESAGASGGVIFFLS